MWLKVRWQGFCTASADHQRGCGTWDYTSWVTQGCKIVNRNLSMTEWNELLVEVLPMKEPARAYPPGRELQKTLQPPTDWHAGRQLRSRRRTEALTDANPGNSRMGLTAQEPLSGCASCVGFGRMIAAWFHLLRRRVRR